MHMTMARLVAAVAIGCGFIGIVLGAWWLIWYLWLIVVPAIWPTGPEILIHPSYWGFVGGWILMVLIGRAIFGARSS